MQTELLTKTISISEENLIRSIGTSRIYQISLKNFAPKTQYSKFPKRSNENLNFGQELRRMEQSDKFKKDLAYFIGKWSIFIKQLHFQNLQCLPPNLEDYFEQKTLQKVKAKFSKDDTKKDSIKIKQINYRIGAYGILYSMCSIESTDKNLIICMNLKLYSIGFKIIDYKIVSSLK